MQVKRMYVPTILIPSTLTFDGPQRPNWMEAEGLHAVENIDSVEFVAIRVELKKGSGDE